MVAPRPRLILALVLVACLVGLARPVRLGSGRHRASKGDTGSGGFQSRRAPRHARQRAPRRASAPSYTCPGLDKTCQAPECLCASLDPPGGLTSALTPQFVLLTFDDAVSVEVANKVAGLFSYTSANGCTVKATFFTSTRYTDFVALHDMWAAGHEIGVHTITHDTGYDSDHPRWEGEINGCRATLSALGNIPFEEIVGFRAPFLEYNEQSMRVLAESGFLYDASIREYGSKGESWGALLSESPARKIFPYSLDHGVGQHCDTTVHDECQQWDVPGVWEVPLWSLDDSNGAAVSVMDDTSFTNLKRNFDAHYTGNRAPIGIFLHAARTNLAPLHQFMQYAASQPNVYFVTTAQLVAWMKNPVSIYEMSGFLPTCTGNGAGPSFPDPTPDCGSPRACINGDLYYRICSESCPAAWPSPSTYVQQLCPLQPVSDLEHHPCRPPALPTVVNCTGNAVLVNGTTCVNATGAGSNGTASHNMTGSNTTSPSWNSTTVTNPATGNMSSPNATFSNGTVGNWSNDSAGLHNGTSAGDNSTAPAVDPDPGAAASVPDALADAVVCNVSLGGLPLSAFQAGGEWFFRQAVGRALLVPFTRVTVLAATTHYDVAGSTALLRRRLVSVVQPWDANVRFTVEARAGSVPTASTVRMRLVEVSRNGALAALLRESGLLVDQVSFTAVPVAVADGASRDDSSDGGSDSSAAGQETPSGAGSGDQGPDGGMLDNAPLLFGGMAAVLLAVVAVAGALLWKWRRSPDTDTAPIRTRLPRGRSAWEGTDTDGSSATSGSGTRVLLKPPQWGTSSSRSPPVSARASFRGSQARISPAPHPSTAELAQVAPAAVVAAAAHADSPQRSCGSILLDVGSSSRRPSAASDETGTTDGGLTLSVAHSDGAGRGSWLSGSETDDTDWSDAGSAHRGRGRGSHGMSDGSSVDSRQLLLHRP